MKVALCQLDPTVADFDGNAAKILDAYRASVAEGADLVVSAELALCGYPPLDLLHRPDFIARAERALAALAAQVGAVPLVVGSVRRDDSAFPALRNAAFLVADGEIRDHHDKRLLPTYDVFDEARYFAPGDRATVWSVAGQRVGVAICEELWDPDGALYPVDPVAELRGAVDLVLSPSASPFHAGKQSFRRALFTRQAERLGAPLLVVNQVGAHDELVFDGGSLAVVGGGVHTELPPFTESRAVVDLSAPAGEPVPPIAHEDEIARAVVAGIEGYFRKSGLREAWIGLSGGIDSAVVAALAVDALGAENVHGVAMPSRYSSEGSLTDAAALSAALGIDHRVVPIESAHVGLHAAIESGVGEAPHGLADENLQARLRGLILMTLSNQYGGAVLATGNKSEMAVGYCTLYGDMCGALAPLGDVTKVDVYAIARSAAYVDRIPASTIEKEPSAELRPDQRDTDSLPPYETLDPILVGYLEEKRGAEELIAAGHDRAVVEGALGRVLFHEYKRRQAAPIIRVSPRAFGIGRRVPLARRREV